MRNDRSEKNRIYMLFLFILTMVLLLACLITFAINIEKNCGIIPLVFIILSVYSIMVFLYHLVYESKVIFKKRKLDIRIEYIFFLIINIILSIISIIVLWL